MADLLSVFDEAWPFSDRNVVFNALDWFYGAPCPAPLAFTLGQVSPPTVIFCAGDLGMDKTINRLMADLQARLFKRQPACNLFRGLSLSKTFKDMVLQGRLSFELTAAPAFAPRHIVSPFRHVTNLNSAIAL